MLDIFKNWKVQFLNYVTAVYRVNNKSASRPNNKHAYFNYLKGVFQIQKDYILKYNINESLKRRIFSDSYYFLIKDAILLNDNEFIEEARMFFEESHMEINSLLNLCKNFIEIEKELNNIKNSKAYKLSEYLFKPLRYIQRKKNDIKNYLFLKT